VQVELVAGPAAVLAVAEPQPLRTGLRAVLPLLRVHAADTHGNPATCPNCEVRPWQCRWSLSQSFGAGLISSPRTWSKPYALHRSGASQAVLEKLWDGTSAQRTCSLPVRPILVYI